MPDRTPEFRPQRLLLCDHRGAGLARATGPLRGAGHVVELSETLRATRAALEESVPDLVVLDPLVAAAGVELEELRTALAGSPATPVLILSDPEDPGPALAAAAALGRTVQGLLRRDATTEELGWQVGRLLQEGARARELSDLRYRASHDDLTDLLRPLYFQARLQEHVSASQRHKLELALVLIDLDRFGQVNKSFDHTVGDRVLAFVAHAIRENLRSEDVAGRIGGDEFAIVLPYTGPLQAAATVRRLGQMIAALSGPVEGSTVELEVGASLGFETTEAGSVDSVEILRAHAEVALRRAKQAGGNQGVYYRSGR